MLNVAIAKEVSLPLAARELRVSGEIARRMLLRGDLDGRLVHGRWLVTIESLERARSGQETPAGTAA